GSAPPRTSNAKDAITRTAVFMAASLQRVLVGAVLMARRASVSFFTSSSDMKYQLIHADAISSIVRCPYVICASGSGLNGLDAVLLCHMIECRTVPAGSSGAASSLYT